MNFLLTHRAATGMLPDLWITGRAVEEVGVGSGPWPYRAGQRSGSFRCIVAMYVKR